MGAVRGRNGTARVFQSTAVNTEDESRGTTQTCTARSSERSLRSGRSQVVKVCESSIQKLIKNGMDTQVGIK